MFSFSCSDHGILHFVAQEVFMAGEEGECTGVMGTPSSGCPPSLWSQLSVAAPLASFVSLLPAKPSKNFGLLDSRCRRGGRHPGVHLRQVSGSFYWVGIHGYHQVHSHFSWRCCLCLPRPSLNLPVPWALPLFWPLPLPGPACRKCSASTLTPSPARLVGELGSQNGFCNRQSEVLAFNSSGREMNCFQGHF